METFTTVKEIAFAAFKEGLRHSNISQEEMESKFDFWWRMKMYSDERSLYPDLNIYVENIRYLKIE